MKRTNPIALLALLVSTISFSFPPLSNAQQVGPGVGAGTDDPKRILYEADQAIRKIQSLSYEATYQGSGSLSTHSPTSSGRVRLSRLEANNPLKARLSAQGDFLATGSADAQPFQVAFDGKTMRKVRPSEKAVIYKTLAGNDPAERSLGVVTGFFGWGAYSLLMLEYILDQPFKRQLSAPVVEYEGRTTVNGVLCHVVYLEYPDAKRITRERWFFGVRDYLPRKLEQIAIDNNGRYGANVLTLSNLKVNPLLGNWTFQIRVPKGYAIKPYHAPERLTLLAVGDLAPDWTLNDAEGRAHSLSEYRGKVIVLDFWATWCGPCIRTMPEIQRLHEKYSSNDLIVFGVNCWEESNSTTYMKAQGFTYGLLLKGEDIAKAYHVDTLPTVYVIGGDGKILYRSIGVGDDLSSFLAKHFEAK
ncbi:MAG TPA: TlpA disulfide reductase family protein [Blastocatellia bacterium]